MSSRLKHAIAVATLGLASASTAPTVLGAVVNYESSPNGFFDSIRDQGTLTRGSLNDVLVFPDTNGNKTVSTSGLHESLEVDLVEGTEDGYTSVSVTIQSDFSPADISITFNLFSGADVTQTASLSSQEERTFLLAAGSDFVTDFYFSATNGSTGKLQEFEINGFNSAPIFPAAEPGVLALGVAGAAAWGVFGPGIRRRGGHDNEPTSTGSHRDALAGARIKNQLVPAGMS